MSRFGDGDYESDYSNAADLWQANARRALKGKRGRKALAELREALLALPEKRLIAGALCTVGGMNRSEMRDKHNYSRGDFEERLATEGEGVCAIGAYVWFTKVKAGTDPEAAFAELPILLDVDSGEWETAEEGQRAGLTYTLAWELAYRNDEAFQAMTPEERYAAFIEWIDKELAA
jgi:hypothetical protein